MSQLVSDEQTILKMNAFVWVFIKIRALDLNAWQFQMLTTWKASTTILLVVRVDLATMQDSARGFLNLFVTLIISFPKLDGPVGWIILPVDSSN